MEIIRSLRKLYMLKPKFLDFKTSALLVALYQLLSLVDNEIKSLTNKTVAVIGGGIGLRHISTYKL